MLFSTIESTGPRLNTNEEALESAQAYAERIRGLDAPLANASLAAAEDDSESKDATDQERADF